MSGISDVPSEGEDPSMVTAADYETQIRPHIAASEAEVERLHEALEAEQRLEPGTIARANADMEVERLRDLNTTLTIERANLKGEVERLRRASDLTAPTPKTQTTRATSRES